MLSARSTFALGLALSATIHAVLWWKLPRYPGSPGSPPPVEKPADIIILPAEKEPEKKPPKEVFGEKQGRGEAINSTAGDKPQAGPKPLLDQAAFTQGPTGNGPAAAAAQPPQPLVKPVTAPPPAALPTPPPSPFIAFRKPNDPSPPAPPAPKAPEGPVTPPTPPVAKVQPSPAATPGGRPLPHADNDVDPFAAEWAAEFQNGEVVSRTGRQLKLKHPDFRISSIADVPEISLPVTLKFKITLDTEGHPRKASVAKSSGSVSIDRAFLLAIYSSWFEPKTDAAGNSVDTEFTFTCQLQ